jgi:hypothetical protein
MMRRIRSRSFAAAILIAAVLSVAGTARAVADEIDQMRLAAHQLAGAQLSSGLLDFDIDFLAGQGVGSGDADIERTAFIVRQADAAYVLAKYLAWSKDTSVSAAVQRLIVTLGSLSLPVGKSTAQRWVESARLHSTPIGRYELRAILEWLGLLYQPTGRGRLLSYEGGYATAWAGGTALALVAELEYGRATGDDRFAELRSSWLEGLRTLQVPSRGFREYPGSIEEAPYANGETWLALATYAALFPADKRVRALLSQYDGYVMGKYSAEPNRQFYSWGTMAAARRLATTSDPKFAAFIAAQASHFVDQEFPAAERRENTCALVEGLAASAAVLAKHDEHRALLQRLMTRIDREMTKNRALQIPTGVIQLDYPGGTFFRSTRLAEYAGAYLSGGGNLYARIDVTAHCLSALMEMQSISAGR